jgi:hypothetical protein
MPAIIDPRMIKTSFLRARRRLARVDAQQRRQRAIPDCSGDQKHNAQRQRDAQPDTGNPAKRSDADK